MSDDTRHPDAELIALCSAFDQVERAQQAISNDDEHEDQFTIAYESSEESQDELFRRICDTPATTIEGLQARAATARLWNTERQYHPGLEAGSILEITDAIWRDLGGRPHPAGHEQPYVSDDRDQIPLTGWKMVEDCGWQRLALFAGPGRIKDDDARTEALEPIESWRDRLCKAMEKYSPVTLDGMRTKARAAVLMNLGLIGEDEPDAGDVVAGLLRDLVGEEFLQKLATYKEQSRGVPDVTMPLPLSGPWVGQGLPST